MARIYLQWGDKSQALFCVERLTGIRAGAVSILIARAEGNDDG